MCVVKNKQEKKKLKMRSNICLVRKNNCRDIGPGSILGLWSSSRTRGCPRKRNLYLKRLC